MTRSIWARTSRPTVAALVAVVPVLATAGCSGRGEWFPNRELYYSKNPPEQRGLWGESPGYSPRDQRLMMKGR